MELGGKGTLRVEAPHLVGSEPTRFAFRLRLVGVVVLAFALPLAAVAWFVAGALESRESDRVDARLVSTLQVVSAAMRADVAETEATARRLAASKAVQTAFLKRDRETLARIALSSPNVSFFVGARQMAGPRLTSGELVRGVTVISRGRPIGRVVATLPLDATLLQRLKAETVLGSGMDVVLTKQGRVLAGSPALGAPVALRPGRPDQARLSGTDYRALDATLVGGSDVRVAATTGQATIDQDSSRTQRGVILAALATLLALAIAADSLAPGVEQMVRRRRQEDEREALELLGNALVAAHDRQALMPVVLATMVEATGAVGGRLFEDGMEVARSGDLSSTDDPLRISLQGGDDARLVLYPPLGGFSSVDRLQAKSLAGQASIALENARLHAIARQEAVTDPLTGLANRRRFMDELALEASRAHRYGRTVAVIIVDLDDFKSINDRFGHAAGDDVLCALAGVLLTSVRDVDLPARLGGEEFAVILPETELEGATVLAERLRKQVEELRLPRPDGTVFPVTASFGVAAYPPVVSPEALLEAADAALYRAKRDGKNRIGMAEAIV